MALRRALQFQPEDLPTPDRPHRRTAEVVKQVEVHIPKYSLQHFPRTLPAHATRTKDLFRLWVRRLDPEDVAYCQDLVRESTLLDGQYGSICRGMDIAATVMKQFWDWARFHWELDSPAFTHKFACEKEPAKRQFLLTTDRKIERMFCNATDLEYDKEIWDSKTNTFVRMPRCTVMTAGFPCQDCSVLNPSSSTSANRSCVADGTLRTGSVLQGIVHYLQSTGLVGPNFCLFENVAGLKTKTRNADGSTGPSNLDHVGHLISTQTDRLLHVWELDPRMFGVPQSRKRLWMTAIPRRIFEGLLPEHEVQKMLNSIMDTLLGLKEISVSEYLVNSRCVHMAKFTTEYNKKLQQLQTRRARRRRAERQDSQVEESQDTQSQPQDRLVGEFRRQSFASSRATSFSHLSTCSSGTRTLKREKIVTKDGLKKFRRAARTRPYLKCMTARKRRTLFKLGVRNFPSETLQVVDISQDKFAHLTNHSPCVTPKGERYLTSECRCMLPLESLRLQGAWFTEDDTRLENFPQSLLADLAGNAFEASCFAATFWATMVCYGRLRALNESSRAGRGPRRALEVPALRRYNTPEFDSQVLLDFDDSEDEETHA
ncbi:unnamed protein product [Symbiodinium sp. CCMP2592]|nr:unnamed protein product [Symbiodinium sp. CCMP2592]